MPIME